MTEKIIRQTENREKPKSMWVKFREPIPNNPNRQEYGLFSWRPNFIPNGSRLEIGVLAANQLLSQMNIGFPIEIKPFHPPNNDQTIVISSFSSRGEATASGVASKVKKPPGSTFFYDSEGEKGELLINFGGLADYLETNMNEGASNPLFYKKLGKLVNRAVRDQVGKIIFCNYAAKGLKEPSVFGIELIKMALCSFSFITTGILGSLASIAESSTTNIPMVLVSGALIGELGWVGTEPAHGIHSMVLNLQILDQE
ncbi:hypothetical protein HY030_03775 [Candidatus Gottesmanbacteria bacterium]|nr:hypothetical protein [Candidatus Gottesmanbacteria bacterium]